MRLTAVDGQSGEQPLWRGALVVRGRGGSAGALIDPTGTVSARLVVDAAFRRAHGLDRPTVPVVLTCADLDQIAALIELRHGNPIDLYTTPALFEALSSITSIWPALQARCALHWRMVPLGGDLHHAQFHVEGQSGIRYTAILLPTVETGTPPPLMLVIEDDASGHQAAWIRGDAADLAPLLDRVAPIWPSISWVLLEPPDPEDPAILDWLTQVPVAHKLLMACAPSLQERAEQAGVMCAVDGLDIVLE